jgi:4-hydroxybenzoyl-CoA thioesterase
MAPEGDDKTKMTILDDALLAFAGAIILDSLWAPASHDAGDGCTKMPFSTEFTARFSDVDPAGIIYFARLIDFFHRALEAYFDDHLHLPYAEMVQKQRIGVPVVRVEGDFFVPVAFGEKFSVQVVPQKIGRTSLAMEYTVFKKETPCAKFVITHVTTDLDAFKPIPIPEALRAAMTRSS